MVHELIRDNVSIDKLKLVGYDFTHEDKRKLDVIFPKNCKYGDDYEPIGFTNRGILKDGLMVDIVGDKFITEFNPNRVPIEMVNDILHDDWGIHTNIYNLDITMIHLERTRLMDKRLIEYHSLLKYVSKGSVKPETRGDTLMYGKGGTLKQLELYSKLPKEIPTLVRAELKLFKDVQRRYDIHKLEYLHDIDKLNEIYVYEYDSYMGNNIHKMLDSKDGLRLYDGSDMLRYCEDLYIQLQRDNADRIPEFIKTVGINCMSYDMWIQFINKPIFSYHKRSRMKQEINKLIKRTRSLTDNIRLGMLHDDLNNLLKFRNVA